MTYPLCNQQIVLAVVSASRKLAWLIWRQLGVHPGSLLQGGWAAGGDGQLLHTLLWPFGAIIQVAQHEGLQHWEWSCRFSSLIVPLGNSTPAYERSN